MNGHSLSVPPNPPNRFKPTEVPALPTPSRTDDVDLAGVLEALSRRRRLALLVLVVSLLGGSIITAWQRAFRPTFEGSFKLLVSDPINTEGMGDREKGGLAELALSGSSSTNTGTLIQVLTSPLLLEPVESRLGLPRDSLAPVLSVSTIKGRSVQRGDDGVLEVTLLWRDPAQGSAILQELSRHYLGYSLRQRQEKLTQGLAFLDQQAPELQQRVNQFQLRLAAFRSANGFVEPTKQAETTLAQRQSLIAQIEQLQQEQARLEGRLAAVRRGDLGTSLATSPTLLPASGLSDPIRTGPDVSPVPPLQELNSVEEALATARSNFTESSPQVRELRDKRDRLKPVLQARQFGELQADLSQNLSQQREIGRQLDRLAGSFRANPSQIKQYESLQQQLDVARANLSSYIQARESFRLQVAQRTVPWSILAPPRFGSRPVKPSLTRGLFLSLVLGGLGGVSLALLRDRMDHVFHDPREIKEAIPLPLLGVVPHLPVLKGSNITQTLMSMDGGKQFETRESLRNLFANFRLLRADKTVRLVALTSATAGEGKSTAASLFALTLVQLGQRVLLVDADMRRPMLHRYVGAENGQGLSSLLIDNSLDLRSCLISVLPGLDLLPAGPMPPDTTRLLSSDRCGEVVEAIRNLPGYDLVLFDTPPAFLLSDPVMLAGHLDGLLFVVGIERVNRDLPGQALERMQGTGVDVLGVLANQSVRRRRTLPSSRYGYGYGYGYSSKRYGGYQDLASRYNDLSDLDSDQTSGVPQNVELSTDENNQSSTLSSEIVVKPSKIQTVMRWLDRRD